MMEHKKKYSTYAEIDRELEILKLEREIYYQKTFVSINKTKENLRLKNIVGGFLGSYKSVFSEISGKWMAFLIPILLKWVLNRKRGN